MTAKVVLEMDLTSDGILELSSHQLYTLKEFVKSCKFIGVNGKFCEMEVELIDKNKFNTFFDEMNRCE